MPQRYQHLHIHCGRIPKAQTGSHRTASQQMMEATKWCPYHSMTLLNIRMSVSFGTVRAPAVGMTPLVWKLELELNSRSRDKNSTETWEGATSFQLHSR